MKTSKYNLIFEHQGKTLAFNSCTCALVEANSEFLIILDNCEKDHFSIEIQLNSLMQQHLMRRKNAQLL